MTNCPFSNWTETFTFYQSRRQEHFPLFPTWVNRARFSSCIQFFGEESQNWTRKESCSLLLFPFVQNPLLVFSSKQQKFFPDLSRLIPFRVLAHVFDFDFSVLQKSIFLHTGYPTGQLCTFFLCLLSLSKLDSPVLEPHLNLMFRKSKI